MKEEWLEGINWEKLLKEEWLGDIDNELWCYSHDIFGILDSDEIFELKNLLESMSREWRFDIFSDFKNVKWGFLRSELWSTKNYIDIKDIWWELHISLLNIPWNGVLGMLHVINYAIINGYSHITLVPATQDDNNTNESLEWFYELFGFEKSNYANMDLELTPDKATYLNNKIQNYISGSKWRD